MADAASRRLQSEGLGFVVKKLIGGTGDAGDRAILRLRSAGASLRSGWQLRCEKAEILDCAG